MVSEWWTARSDWPRPVDPRLLGNFGMLIEYEGVPSAAGWLVVTLSGWVLVEFLVTNPDVSGKKAYKSLKWLLEKLMFEARAIGGIALFSSIQKHGLIRLYQELGWEKTDTGMTNMVFTL